MSLRQKIENHFQNRSGQGSLVAVIVATVMLSTIVAAGTEWYLSMNKSTGRMQEQMAAQSYAYNEWQNVLAEDYDSLSSNARKNVSDKFDLKRDVGAEKTISGSGKEKDVVITVYRKGTDQVAYAMQSGKARPTMDNYYTKEQINSLVKNINKRLDGKEFVKNKTPNYDINFRYEQKTNDDKPKIHAYIENTEIPLGSNTNNYKPSLDDNNGYVKLDNGLIIQYGGSNPYNEYSYGGKQIQQINFPIAFPHKVFSVTITQTLEPLFNGNFSNLSIANNSNDSGTWLLTKSNTGFTFYTEAIMSGEPITGKHFKIYWTAIGY